MNNLREKISRIVDTLYNHMARSLSGEYSPERIEQEAIDQLLALFEEYALEIIGEDEEVDSYIPTAGVAIPSSHYGKNLLRAEQRERLKE